MENKNKYTSALNVNKGIDHPPSVNPDVIIHLNKNKRKKYSVDEYIDEILSGNRTFLSRAITLIESSLTEHYDTAQSIVEKCLPFSGNSIRIGITGIPGAGKSTFIETLGKLVTSQGRKLAVLAVDPSSQLSKGSILGDKTRMERLSIDPLAFIRPSPAAGTLGGVARKTRETIILCEAAGFDTIFVETVGVGQSETAVGSMVDFFLLLMLAGAGDELQGIKRGIMEIADTIAITKADGNNIVNAERVSIEFQTALHLFPPFESGWIPKVLTCSAIENTGIDTLWDTILDYFEFTKATGFFNEKRKHQAVIRMHEAIIESLKASFYDNRKVKQLMPDLEKQLYEGRITSYSAAFKLLNRYFNNRS
jgi:LAO/AO transport system kinase